MNEQDLPRVSSPLAEASAPPPALPVPPPRAVPELGDVGGVVADLLKDPDHVAYRMSVSRQLPGACGRLLAVALAGHALFGLAVGLFGGWRVGLMDLAKAPAIALGALLLCLPSLYVFACVGGAPLSLAQAFTLGASSMAMVGLILAALAPVVWLFAVSTSGAGFIVVLALGLWLVAIYFALNYIGKVQAYEPFRQASGIRYWFLVLAIVSLQMVTLLRPMLSLPAEGWREPGKMFFLKHIGGMLEEQRPERSTPYRR